MSKRSEEELIIDLITIVEELGWTAVIPSNECNGMIIGSDEFLKEINIDIDSSEEELTSDGEIIH